MRVIEMIIKFKAHSQDGVGKVAVTNTDFEQRLAEISTQVKGWDHLRPIVIVTSVV
jgi:hypothetical protein